METDPANTPRKGLLTVYLEQLGLVVGNAGLREFGLRRATGSTGLPIYSRRKLEETRRQTRQELGLPESPSD